MFLKVKVFPSSKKEKVEKIKENSYKIFVKAKPERGLANEAVFRLLSQELGISVGKIRLLKGGRKKNKILEVRD